MKNNKTKRKIRHKKIRAKVFGTVEMPRLSVFRSNKHIFAQIIDDTKGKTLVSVGDLSIKKKDKKENLARIVGMELAKLAKEKNIKKIIFDRGGYKYHGRIKALAEGAREAGLKF